MAETSTKPYMIRALYEWCCDNGYTPYLAVSVDEHTVVPRQHVKGGEIVLNVSPMATSRLSLGNEMVEFQARFNGIAQQISIPVGNVSAIYSRETGQGMAFEVVPTPTEKDEDHATDAGAGSEGLAPSGDESVHHARGSTVQPLRGGARRRSPRTMDLEGIAGTPEASAEARPSASDVGVEELHREGGEVGGSALTSSSAGSKGAAKSGTADVAANSRKRARREEGSADVLAFAPSADSAKKKGGGSTGGANPASTADGASQGPDGIGEGEDPPPTDGGGKGGKARLTRVK
jgi:stringent starvation protein B